MLSSDQKLLNQAVKILKAGGIIAFPTDTVYALACDASNDEAVRRIYHLKKRQENKPIAVFIKDLTIAKKIFLINKICGKIVKSFMPGALTIIVRKKNKPGKNIRPISSLLNQGSEMIGFRIPDDEFSLQLLKKFNGIIAATSVNISGKKPAITYEEVIKYFDKKIDMIIKGAPCRQGIASTVIRIDDDNQITILRAGLITKKQIENELS